MIKDKQNVDEHSKEYYDDFKQIEDAKRASNHDLLLLFGVPIYHSVAEYKFNKEELDFITNQKTRPNGKKFVEAIKIRIKQVD